MAEVVGLEIKGKLIVDDKMREIYTKKEVICSYDGITIYGWSNAAARGRVKKILSDWSNEANGVKVLVFPGFIEGSGLLVTEEHMKSRYLKIDLHIGVQVSYIFW